MAALDAAVAAGREAVAATVHDRARGRHLTNLSSSLQVRFLRKGDPADLAEAVAASEEAVAACAEPHPGPGPGPCPYSAWPCGHVTTPSRGRHRRRPHRRRPPGRDRRRGSRRPAVGGRDTRHGRDAAWPAFQPGRCPARALPRARTGRRRRRGRAYRAGGPGALFRGPPRAGHLPLEPGPLPVRAGPGGPSRASYDPELLRQALAAWRRAVSCEQRQHATSLCAANWARTARDAGLAAEAEAGYTAVVAMLPLVAWRGLNRATQESQLALWGRLTTEAAAAAITAGHPGAPSSCWTAAAPCWWSRCSRPGLRPRRPRPGGCPDLGKPWSCCGRHSSCSPAARPGQTAGAWMPPPNGSG